MKIPFLAVIVTALVLSACVVIPHNRHVASKVNGRMLMNGTPLAQVKVTREITVGHSGEKMVQHAVTDLDGGFVWDEVTTVGMVKSISTWAYTYRFYAYVGGEEILFWFGNKTDNFQFGELGYGNYPSFPSGRDFFEKRGDVLYFSCDLSSRLRTTQEKGDLPTKSRDSTPASGVGNL